MADDSDEETVSLEDLYSYFSISVVVRNVENQTAITRYHSLRGMGSALTKLMVMTT